ncbi:MAG: TMEM165/GDT1 family protein [Candidatus Omnitrophica bacterium]|nr:TMEM165/GDT1 family protein [Candidatus Omnitrophota bacterium]
MTHFLIPFISVALAELGDKTQLAVMLLASRTQRKTQLFFGVMSAFFLVDGMAIISGAWIRNKIPMLWISLTSGILFLVFGVMSLCHQKEDESSEKKSGQNPFWLGFTMIAAAEWGDKTQIASGIFGAKFHLMGVFAGTLSALAVLSLLAIAAGDWVSRKIPAKRLHKIAGILFIVLGFFFIWQSLGPGCCSRSPKPAHGITLTHEDTFS